MKTRVQPKPAAEHKKLSTDWFAGKNDKDKEAIEFVLRNNVALIQAVLDVIDRYEKEEDRGETNLTQYDSPAWGYKQADRNGARRALQKVKNLFNIL